MFFLLFKRGFNDDPDGEEVEDDEPFDDEDEVCSEPGPDRAGPFADGKLDDACRELPAESALDLPITV